MIGFWGTSTLEGPKRGFPTQGDLCTLSCGELATRWGQMIGNGSPPPALGGDTRLPSVKAKTPPENPLWTFRGPYGADGWVYREMGCFPERQDLETGRFCTARGLFQDFQPPWDPKTTVF